MNGEIHIPVSSSYARCKSKGLSDSKRWGHSGHGFSFLQPRYIASRGVEARRLY